jgi:hypothetical protein
MSIQLPIDLIVSRLSINDPYAQSSLPGPKDPTATVDDPSNTSPCISACESEDLEDDVSSTSASSNDTSRASSADPLSQDSELSPVLDATARLIVDRLMGEFHYLLGQNSPLTRCPEGIPNSASSSSAQSSSSTVKPQGRSSGERSRGEWKRKLGSSEDGDELDDEQDGDEPRKRTMLSPPHVDRNSKLACPYYKRNPLGPNHRSCAGPGWETVHRVK